MMKNAFEKMQKFSSKYVVFIVAILVIMIAIGSFFITAYFDNSFVTGNEKTSYKMDSIFLNFFLSILMIFVIGILSKGMKKINNKVLVSILFGITLVASLLWVIHLKLTPESDQGNVVIAAQGFQNPAILESYLQKGGYLDLYPFQTGFSTYIYLIYQLFQTNDFMYLEILNVIYSCINLVLMYKITKILFKSEMVEKIAILLLAGFNLYFVFFNVHIYGNIIGLMFALMALLRNIKISRNKKMVLLLYRWHEYCYFDYIEK